MKNKYVLGFAVALILSGCGGSDSTSGESSGQYGSVNFANGPVINSFAPCTAQFIRPSQDGKSDTIVYRCTGSAIESRSVSYSPAPSSPLVQYQYAKSAASTFHYTASVGSAVVQNHANRTLTFSNAKLNISSGSSPSPDAMTVNGTLKY